MLLTLMSTGSILQLMDTLAQIPTADAVPGYIPGTGKDITLYDDRRVMPGYRVGKAWHHFRELLKDKENTAEVFHIFESLPWKGVIPAGRAFLTLERGQRIRESEPFLPDLLDDHEALRKLPEGSLAHAYCDFMEAEGLTAHGLVDEFDKFADGRMVFDDQFQWYFNRLRDVHDLLHVLTGYGRDALGEQCVLAFTYSQQPSPAHLFIGYAGGLEIKKGDKFKVPVFKAIREAQKQGKACPRIMEQPVRELLALPLEEARRRLNITPARYYAEAHAIWRANGIDPYDLLGTKKAA